MKLLDLFCGAGGAAVGYNRAGFDQILGVDHEPQPRYPFDFVQADALDWLRQNDATGFDLIHASPPCQAYTALRHRHAHKTYPDLISQTRQLLQATGRPYVIENVPGAPLQGWIVTLCGAMFKLRSYRHRLFETSIPILNPPHPLHRWKTARQGSQPTADQFVTVTGGTTRKAIAAAALGIDWMLLRELSQAIPPAYTQWLGDQLIPILKRRTQCQHT